MMLNLLFFFTLFFNVVIGDNSACASEGASTVGDFVSNGGFLFLLLGVFLSLWALALVCEEFFVPALQVLCDRWKIPQSVAGSLIMAAGNNAVSLFIFIFVYICIMFI